MKGDFAEQLETPIVDVDDDRPPNDYVTLPAVRIHAGLLFSIAIVIIGTMFIVLGCMVGTGAADANSERPSTEFSEIGMFFLAVAAGAAGAAIHALTSFATFAGNRQLTRGWLPWLYLRVPIGALLAILVYFGVRASAFEGSDSQNVYFVAFLCALSGLFSKQATDKLSDLIDNLLMPARKPARDDPLEGEAATLKTHLPSRMVEEPPQETVQEAQRRLIALGYLGRTAASGKPADDGVLGPTTRDAVERFLAEQGIVGEARANTIGQEPDPDYWPNLLDLLEQAKKSRK